MCKKTTHIYVIRTSRYISLLCININQYFIWHINTICSCFNTFNHFFTKWFQSSDQIFCIYYFEIFTYYTYNSIFPDVPQPFHGVQVIESHFWSSLEGAGFHYSRLLEDLSCIALTARHATREEARLWRPLSGKGKGCAVR